MYKGWKFENPKKLKNCIRVCVCGLGRKVFFQGNILMWNCTLGLGFLGLFLGSFGTAAAAVAAAALVVVGTCAGIVWAECEHGQGGGTAAAAACTTAFCSELLPSSMADHGPLWAVEAKMPMPTRLTRRKMERYCKATFFSIRKRYDFAEGCWGIASVVSE